MSDIEKYIKKGVKDFSTDPNKALQWFKKALSAYNTYVLSGEPNQHALDTIYGNISLAYDELGDYATSNQWSDKIVNKSYDVLYKESLCFYHLKNLTAANKLYFNRYLRKSNDCVSFPDLPVNRIDPLNPQNIDGKSIIVLNEQGLGDELMFIRCIPYLATAKKVWFQCYPETFELLKSNFKQFTNIEFFTERTLKYEFVTSFDYWTCTGDLWIINQKQTPPVLVNGTINLNLDKSKIHVGFVDAPNGKSKNAKSRAVNLKAFKDLSKVPNVVMHNLHLGQEISFAQNYTNSIKCLNDTLGIIENLDVIFTVDTSVAHLAAMSKTPAYVVARQYVDWRWKNGFYDIEVIKPVDMISKLKLYS